MALTLDAVAVLAVAGALAFLLRPARRGCAECARHATGTEARIPLHALRARLRRESGRR